jgi:FkbM family methyltransferase
VRSSSTLLGKSRIGRVFVEEMADAAMTRTHRVSHGGTELVFTVPNSMNRWRIATFSSKEPETLEWIDAMPRGSVLWDIGANVGLYSCYAAKARGCRVVAFEPSVFNLELLARNVFLNGLAEAVTIVPVPLCERTMVNALNMTSTQWGGALSSFGASWGFDGQPLEKKFEYRTVGTSMDEALELFSLPLADYLKIDVDGIEHLVLRGGTRVLSQVRSVSVEVNDAFPELAEECARLLAGAGLRFVGKRHAAMFDETPAYSQTYNQVWAR